MRKHYHKLPITNILCRGIIFGIALFIALLLLDDTPHSKTVFLAQFVEFVQDVSAEHETFTTEDWERADRRFKRYTREHYKLFANQLTDAERKTLRQYKRLYLYYRTKKHVNSMIERFEDIIVNSK